MTVRRVLARGGDQQVPSGVDPGGIGEGAAAGLRPAAVEVVDLVPAVPAAQVGEGQVPQAVAGHDDVHAVLRPRLPGCPGGAGRVQPGDPEAVPGAARQAAVGAVRSGHERGGGRDGGGQRRVRGVGGPRRGPGQVQRGDDDGPGQGGGQGLDRGNRGQPRDGPAAGRGGDLGDHRGREGSPQQPGRAGQHRDGRPVGERAGRQLSRLLPAGPVPGQRGAGAAG